jgi:hypothetical protein
VTRAAVWVQYGGRLDLNGHTIGGETLGIAGGTPDGTGRPGTVRVRGPGMVSRTYLGISGTRMVVTDVSAHDNYAGIWGPYLRLRDVDASGNIVGVAPEGAPEGLGWARAVRLVSDDNLLYGMISYVARVRLSNSQLIDNGRYDLVAEYGPPRLRRTTCDRSAQLHQSSGGGYYIGYPWGICSGD